MDLDNPETLADFATWCRWRESFEEFCTQACQIQESQGGWEQFRPWPDQTDVIRTLERERFVLVLKARQLGLTWLCLYELLWLAQSRPGIQCGVFSLRETEAAAVLDRIRLVWEKLPKGCSHALDSDSKTYLKFKNGSSIRAFSTTSGDSYTLGAVLIDEADLIPDLDRVLRGAKPTIDAGGRIRLISRADKTRPESLFKAMFRAARDGQSEYKALFLPWNSRPSRTQEWYDQQVRSAMAETGTRDVVLEQYPATPEEALAPGESDKRIPVDWISRALRPAERISHPLETVAEIYSPPVPGRRYSIGGDPAEGNPTSDESAAVVLSDKGEHVATVRGRRQPAAFAAVLAQLARAYNKAGVLVERNNHGHAVILALNESHGDVWLLCGRDGKTGWLSSALGKVQLYDGLVECLRDQTLTIASRAVADQLQLIQGRTLRAPEGMHDDLADAYALASAARLLVGVTPGQGPAVFKPREELPRAYNFKTGDPPPAWRK